MTQEKKTQRQRKCPKCQKTFESDDEEVEREAERNAAATRSEHVGSVGGRLRGLELTVLRASHHECQCGGTTLVVFSDAEGRRFKWWASGSRTLKPGWTFRVDGTVKAHDEWQGVKEMVLTRVKKSEWECPTCSKIFKSEGARAKHYDKEHPIPEVDDSFYD